MVGPGRRGNETRVYLEREKWSRQLSSSKSLSIYRGLLWRVLRRKATTQSVNSCYISELD